MHQVAGPRGYLDWCGLTYRHALAMSFDHYGYMKRMADRFGGLVPFTILQNQCYLISDPRLIHEAFVSNAKSIRKQKRNTAFIESVLSRGMLTIQGPEWRRDRLAVQKQIREQGICEVAWLAQHFANEVVDSWETESDVNFHDVAGSILMRTLTSYLFGKDSGQDTERWYQASVDLSDRQMREVLLPFHFPDWVPLPAQRKKRHAKRVMRDAALSLMSAADAGQRTTFCSALQQAWADRPEEIRDVICSEAMTFVIAGVHTTAAALEWTLWEIIKAPEIQDTLRNELVSNGIDGHLPEMTKVILEGIRKHPPVWAMIVRQATEDFDLAGQMIEKDSWLFVYPRIVHRMERWFPDPDRFDPSRFDDPQATRQPAFMPFGVGPHRCIGAPLAETILPTVIGTILLRYWLEPTEATYRVVPRFSTVMYPQQGVSCRAIAAESRVFAPPAIH